MIFFIFLLQIKLSFALTENDLARFVLENFPLIQEAELKRNAARGEWESAEGAFDHKLSFESRNRIEDKYDNQYFQTTLSRNTGISGTELLVGHRQGLGHFPAYDGKYQTSGAGEVFAGITMPLLRDRRTDESRTNLALREIDLKLAEAEIQLKKNQYLHKALSLYYKWVLEQQKLKIYQNVLELAESRHHMIESKFKAGDIERLKIDDNLRSIDKRRADLIRSQIEIDKLQAELSLYARDKSGQSLPLAMTDPKIVLLRPEENLKRRDLKNPQLTLLELQRKRFKLLQALAEQSQLPGLALQLLGAKELSGNAAYDPQSLQVGLKFDFPLENRKAEGKTVANSYKFQAMEKKLLYTEQELKRFATFSQEASAQSRKRYEVITREFENAEKLARAEKTRWIQGSSDLFVVNLREQDLADVEIRRWSSLYDYHQYLLDFHLFDGSFPHDI
jgi:outer membrane protein, heavy metal efflux system